MIKIIAVSKDDNCNNYDYGALSTQIAQDNDCIFAIIWGFKHIKSEHYILIETVGVRPTTIINDSIASLRTLWHFKNELGIHSDVSEHDASFALFSYYKDLYSCDFYIGINNLSELPDYLFKEIAFNLYNTSNVL